MNSYMHTLLPYIGLFAAAAAFEFAYVAWARAAASGGLWTTAAWSVATAGLGLLGLAGALDLHLGWLPYLAGIGLGALTSASLGRRSRIVPG